MWISRAQFFDLAAKAALAEGKAATLAEQNMVLRTSLDWMQIRVRQIETERAQLLFMVSGVKATVPVVESVVEADPFAKADLFADMGDEEAKRQGIGWDAHGNLIRK